MNSEENPEDKIYIALGHRLRRDIIRLLAEKRKLSFSDFMKELNIEDTGTLTFHLRKLSGLISKTSSGDYVLTDLGWRAYSIMKSIEDGTSLRERIIKQDIGRESTASETKGGRELKPDIVFIVDRIKFTLDRQMLEQVKALGKKLIIEDVITLEIADDVDPQLFQEVVESIRDVAVVRVPKHLRAVVELKARDVASIREGGKVLSFIPSLSRLISDVVTGVAEAISTAVKSASEDIGRQLTRIPVYETTFSNISGIECELHGGRLRVVQWDRDEARATVYSYSNYSNQCRYSIDVRGTTLIVELKGCDAELQLPRIEINSIDVDVEGGFVEVALETPLDRILMNMHGGYTALKLDNQKNVGVEVVARGGTLNIGISYVEFEGISNIELELAGGYLDIDIEAPENTRVLPSTASFGGFTKIDVDEKLRNVEESRRVIEISSKASGGLCNIKIRRKQ